MNIEPLPCGHVEGDHDTPGGYKPCDDIDCCDRCQREMPKGDLHYGPDPVNPSDGTKLCGACRRPSDTLADYLAMHPATNNRVPGAFHADAREAAEDLIAEGHTPGDAWDMACNALNRSLAEHPPSDAQIRPAILRNAEAALADVGKVHRDATPEAPWTVDRKDLEPGPNQGPHPKLRIVLDYADGDKGTHEAGALEHLLWTHFSVDNGHEARRIVIERENLDEEHDFQAGDKRCRRCGSYDDETACPGAV